MTAGTLVEFTSYLGIVYAPITSLLNSYMTMIKNLAISNASLNSQTCRARFILFQFILHLLTCRVPLS